MTTQISVESLSQITHNQIPVLTTELLAHLYGTDVANIKMNHSRNQTRFLEGKHYFKVVGDDLKNWRVTFSYLQISPKTRPSSSGQNAEQPATQKCSKPIRRGMRSKNWKTVISVRNNHQPHKNHPSKTTDAHY